MAQVVGQQHGPYDTFRPDLKGRDEKPMSKGTGSDGEMPSRSGPLIALVVGIILLIVAVIVSTGGLLFPGPGPR